VQKKEDEVVKLGEQIGMERVMSMERKLGVVTEKGVV
jgi:hypothetical protein